MADSKISALPASTTPLAGTEVLPIVQSGATKKVSVANLTAGRAVDALSYNATSFSRVTAEGAAIGSTGQSLQAVRTTNDSVLFLGYRTTPDAWVIGASYTSTGAYKPILFATSDTARWQIEAAGNLTQKTAAKGIDFTANTPAAGMQSQLLNWYEEGTWTATLIGTTAAPTTPVTVTGLYTRVGRQVTVYASFVAVNTTGATGDVRVTGLPFTVGSQASIGAAMTNGFVVTSPVCTAESGTTYINVRDGATTVLVPMVAGANKYLTLQVTYSV